MQHTFPQIYWSGTNAHFGLLQSCLDYSIVEMTGLKGQQSRKSFRVFFIERVEPSLVSKVTPLWIVAVDGHFDISGSNVERRVENLVFLRII